MKLGHFHIYLYVNTALFMFLGTINFIFFLIFNLNLSSKYSYGIINKTYSLGM